MFQMRRSLIGIAFLAAFSGACTLESPDVPPLTGPSALSLSLVATASPDILPEDGMSQSVIRITARNQFGQPVPNLPLRVDTMVGSTIVEFGTLSARNVTTNANGEATVTFTAPRAPQIGVDTGNIVTIAVRQIGTDFLGTSLGTATSIRLVPQSTPTIPGAPDPNFSFSPTNPRVDQTIQFDASSSSDDGTIVRYRWDWGDGDFVVENHPRQDHSYSAAGTYLVTLTVTDNEGKSSSITRPVTVSSGS